MTAKELRIGNYFEVDDQLNLVDRITDKGVNVPHNGYGLDIYSNDEMFQYSSIKPVPLTEEWLLKFGFVNNGQDVYDLEGWIPFIRKRKGFYQVYNVPDCLISFVHELQNLYFALTSKELVLESL